MSDKLNVSLRQDVFDRFSVRHRIRDAIADPSAFIGGRYYGEGWAEDDAHWKARAVIAVVRDTLTPAEAQAGFAKEKNDVE